MVTRSTLERVACMASSLANWCAQESQLDVDVDVVLVVSFGDGDVEDVDDDLHGAELLTSLFACLQVHLIGQRRRRRGI